MGLFLIVHDSLGFLLSLSRRPTQRATSKHVQVDMGNFLAPVLATIQHTSESALIYAQLTCHLVRRQQQTAEHIHIRYGRIHKCWDNFFRYNEYVYRRRRMNILEGTKLIILIYYGSGNLMLYDSQKNRLLFHVYLSSGNQYS